jgi:glucose/arabinose dehydrogenase
VPRPRPRLIWLALGLALVAAGCTDSDGEQSAGADPPAARATTAAPAPTTASPTSGSGTSAAPGTSTPRSDPGTTATSAPTTTTSTPRPDPAAASLTVLELATVDRPVDVVSGPDDALYVAEQGGRALRLEAAAGTPEVYLDLSDRVSTGNEQGLLGLEFTADRFYASYTDTDGTSMLVSWAFDGAGRPDLASEQVVLRVEQPFANHNGGDLAFGPDGYLYWSLGDGGSGGDPQGHGQNPATLLGSILRIEPTPDGPQPYAVPPDNPFADGRQGAPEVWVYGLRNPWRISFDSATGDLWIGDVGQSTVEEVDHLPAGTAAGANLGWNLVEGNEPFAGEPPEGHVPPVFTYGRDEGVSVIGGVMYRGSALPTLVGAYLFSDAFGGWIDALVVEPVDAAAADPAVEHFRLLADVGPISAFGQTADGEVVLTSLDGRVLALVPA